MHQQIALDEVPEAHPVAVFARFWSAAAPGSATPPWSIFDPVDHPAVLPWILLFKAEGDSDLRCVVCGDGCSEIFGFSYQGKLFGESLPPDAVEIRKQEFARVEANRAPEFSKTSLPIEGKTFIDIYRGVFPFLTADGAMERIMVVIAPVETVCR